MTGRSERRLSAAASPAQVWAFSVGTSVGWGSLVVTANTYLAQSGPLGSALGLLVGMAVMLVISRNYAYLMNVYPEAGGAYAFSREIFGHDFGFLTAWFLGLVYLAILWANVTSLPLFARFFLGGVFRFGRMYTLFGYDVYFGEALLSIAGLVAASAICLLSCRTTTMVMLVLVCIFILGIFAVFLGVIFRPGVSLSPSYAPGSAPFGQIVRIAVISPWAFIGFESISHSAEEFSFPHRKTFPILVISVVCTTLLYICVTLLSVTAYPPEYASWTEYIRDLGNLEGLKALPAFYAAQHYLGPFGVGALMVSLLALVLTSFFGNLRALSRLLFALGRDRVFPEKLSELNRHGVPGNAVKMVTLISLLIPFLGRTAIGWIVDVTTIGATIIYALVSLAAMRLAGRREDRLEKSSGIIGFVIMVLFGAYLLLPDLMTAGDMAKETYFLFIVWSILGFIAFRIILNRDKSKRFGKSIVVWAVLLTLVLLISLIWMRQSMIDSNRQMLDDIRDYYAQSSVLGEERSQDKHFIEEQLNSLESADTKSILMATGMFAFALLIMGANFSYMNKRAKESERIAFTDPMTGVKSKHAYMVREQELDGEITDGSAGSFAVVVCDVNGLKHINDTYGHKAGDKYIRDACALVCELFQHSPVYRVGGDEFVVILTGRDFENRRELLAALQSRSEANIGTDNVVISAGVSDFRPGEDADVHHVFHRADERMYQNKQALKAKGARTR